jgi:hypothetical protein
VTFRVLPWLAGVLVLASCTGDSEPRPQPLDVAWQQVDLPTPPGRDGRLAVRDAVRCADRWYVVGAVFPPDSDSRPAVWSSADGRSWTSLVLRPVDYWAKRAVLSSVACRDGEVAMVGAQSGGAHGNPRVRTWYRRDDGVFVDASAGFELYGGPSAVNVGSIAAGPDTWLIVGNRTSGPAVWLSDDATDFRIVEGAPHLSNDAESDAMALDQVYDGHGWTLVGGAHVPGRLARVPMAWVSPDGETWQRQELPETDGYDDLQRVIRYGDGLLAAGLRDRTFGVWRRDSDQWTRGASFGAVIEDFRTAPSVSGLVAAGDVVLATVNDGSHYSLWASDDAAEWREVRTPTTSEVHNMTIETDGSTVLLLADDGEAGRVWLATPPAP